MLGDDVTQDFLNKIFYIKDGELFWKERKQEDFTRSINFFNKKYANKIAGVTDCCGVRKVGITVSRGVYLRGVDVEEIKYKMITGGYLVKSYISDHSYFHVWSNMRGRCGRISNYIDVKLSEDFNTFDKFLSWAEAQKGFMEYDEDGRIFEIDKDILAGGLGKCYSKDSCVFVPRVLNLLAYQKRRTNLPKGVQYFKGRKKPYRAYMTKENKLNHFGYFNTVEEAASVVRDARLNYIRQLENKFKEVVDERVFPAIYELHKSW